MRDTFTQALTILYNHFQHNPTTQGLQISVALRNGPNFTLQLTQVSVKAINSQYDFHEVTHGSPRLYLRLYYDDLLDGPSVENLYSMMSDDIRTHDKAAWVPSDQTILALVNDIKMVAKTASLLEPRAGGITWEYLSLGIFTSLKCMERFIGQQKACVVRAMFRDWKDELQGTLGVTPAPRPLGGVNSSAIESTS